MDGQEVVVKVQRPEIETIIAVDLEILAHLAQLMEQYLEEMQGHRPTAIVEEFARSLSREIDFSIEIANIQRFSRQFGDNKTIRVIKVYPELSSTRILVMEFVKGIKASAIDRLKDEGRDLKLVAERGCNLVMEQIFIHGFFHADPHPGNIFILEQDIVCFVDFGQMGRLSLRDREMFTDLVMHLVSGDEQKLTLTVLALTLHDDDVDTNTLSRDLGELMDRYLYQPLGKLEAGKMLHDLMELTSRHRIYFKPDTYLMIKAISTVEGVGLMLDPDLQIIRLAEPFMKKIRTGRIKPARIASEVAESGEEYFSLLRALPQELRSILTQLRSGKMRLAFEHKGIEALRQTLDQLSNRIAFAIVLASLIIGSSLIVLSGIPPKWYGIPVIGLVGYLMAGVMGFWLLISIIRHGRM